MIKAIAIILLVFISNISRAAGTDINKALRTGVDAFNKTAPKLIDPDTRLDSMSSSDMEIRYNITFINYSWNDARLANFEAISKFNMISNICNQVKGNTIRRDYLNNGVTVTYAYSDKNKVLGAVIPVSLADCNKPQTK